jgi:hypothetical protein
MARKLKTYQTSLGFFDQAIAAERAALERRSQAENARSEKQKRKLDLAVRRPAIDLRRRGSDLKVPLPALP